MTSRRRSWWRLLVALGALTLGAPAWAQAGGAEAAFKKQCASCHGPDGKANTPAGRTLKIASWSHSSKLEGMTDAQIAQLIRTGVKKDKVVKMPPHPELSDEQVHGLVAYVRSLAK